MDAIELLKLIRDFLKTHGIDIPDEVFAWIVLILAVGALLAPFIWGIVKAWKWISSLRQEPWIEKKINEILSPDYLDQLKEQEYFISTKYTTSPPHNHDDPMEVERIESAKSLIDHFLEKVLVEDNTTNRFFCILAGAGMGKTTWTVNLVTSYIRKYKKGEHPYEISLISLAHKDFADKVNHIEGKHHTILILDALDENADASNNLDVFMQNLEHMIQDFRFVILTSRTQFFPSEEAEPYKTKIPKLSGDKGNFVFHKMYISPFSHEDVVVYLRRKYKKRKLRNKAFAIIEQCESLSTRPLLLSHLDDLLDGTHSYDTLSDIYGALIDAWARREVRFATGDENDNLCGKLYDFSLNFALELFANREQSTNMRMTKSQYEEFIQKHNYTDYNFSGRSLINRDAEGTLKFSHKTFYEYFLAKAKFANPDIEIPNSGYELAWTFYDQMVCARLREIPESHITMINHDTVLCLRKLGLENFDYRWFDRVKNIRRVGVAVSILENNTDNFTAWLLKSDVQIVDIIGYKNNNLKKLLNVPNLKEVNILYTAKISTKGRMQMRRLEESRITVIDSKLNAYPNYETLWYYRGRTINEDITARLLQDYYEEFVRTREATARYLVESTNINTLTQQTNEIKYYNNKL